MRLFNGVFLISSGESNKSTSKEHNEVTLKSYKKHNDYTGNENTSSIDVVSDSANTKLGIYHQILTTSAVLLLAIACGMPSGYSAVLLPQLVAPNSTSDLVLDIEMASWVASIHSLANPIGALASGPLADYFGRRATLFVSMLPMLIGWIVLALSQSYPVLMVGRFVCGFATGMLGGPGHVYIAETTEPKLRNLLIGAPFIAYSLGILIIYGLGSTLHWRSVAWYSVTIPALAAVAMLCVPETPAWLIRNKKAKKAKKALIFLRGDEKQAQKELNELNERLQQESTATKTTENIFKLCCQRIAIKPLTIVTLFSLLQMASGTFLIIFYAVDIISEFDADFDSTTAAIWTAVVRMISNIILCVVLVFVRRRRLLLSSSIVSGLGCLVLSIYMYVRVDAVKTSMDIIVAASCLFVYIAFNTVLMVMPGIMVGELLPSKIRGRTSGALFAAMNVALFGLTKAFPLIQSHIGLRGVFMMFAVASFLITATMFLLQPETKGRSLEQIEDYFQEDNWFWFKRSGSFTSAISEGIHKKTDKA